MTKWTRQPDIFNEIKKDLKAIEEEIMSKDNKTEEEQSTTEKILDSILEKGLSIMNKVLTRVDKKLDDEEFMKKLEDNIQAIPFVTCREAVKIHRDANKAFKPIVEKRRK